MLRVAELFAGVCAQREALKRARIEQEIVARSAMEKPACMAYEALHGKIGNAGGIRKVKELPEADPWTHSFPCADISIIGKMRLSERGASPTRHCFMSSLHF